MLLTTIEKKERVMGWTDLDIKGALKEISNLKLAWKEMRKKEMEKWEEKERERKMLERILK